MSIAEIKLPEYQFASKVNTNKIARRSLLISREFFDRNDFTGFLFGR